MTSTFWDSLHGCSIWEGETLLDTDNDTQRLRQIKIETSVIINQLAQFALSAPSDVLERPHLAHNDTQERAALVHRLQILALETIDCKSQISEEIATKAFVLLAVIDFEIDTLRQLAASLAIDVLSFQSHRGSV